MTSKAIKRKNIFLFIMLWHKACNILGSRTQRADGKRPRKRGELEMETNVRSNESAVIEVINRMSKYRYATSHNQVVVANRACMLLDVYTGDRKADNETHAYMMDQIDDMVRCGELVKIGDHVALA